MVLDAKLDFDVGADGRLLVLREASEERPHAQTILIEGWGQALARALGAP